MESGFMDAIGAVLRKHPRLLIEVSASDRLASQRISSLLAPR
jgi:hypothetical protein